MEFLETFSSKAESKTLTKLVEIFWTKVYVKKSSGNFIEISGMFSTSRAQNIIVRSTWYTNVKIPNVKKKMNIEIFIRISG